MNTVTVLVIVGIVFHLVYTLSIFDIYFKSPLIHGIQPQLSTSQPPSKRIVLFVGDGLRADKLYELDYHSGKSRAPFLRSIVLDKGSWGVSHTRVPTESRPGHVAMIAGFYEDVSAVTKGWKKNPVEFDSVFNQSTYTWSFGSPDILPIFANEDTPHIYTEMYEPEHEDFGSADASHLDTWVFERVERLFESAKSNSTLKELLHREKVVFFLHLLGIDTTGHAYRPYSEEYYDNIRVVDEGVQKMYQMIEEFYGDGKTAYVFTSDHGMSNKGSHGDGEEANTETPIICWGAGIQNPKAKDGTSSRPSPPEWSFDHLRRLDINQADVAPLLSTLIGVPYPMNSVGVLPTEFLDMSEEAKVESLVTNAKSIFAQYEKKSETKKMSSFTFQPFSKTELLHQQAKEIESYLRESRLKEAEFASKKFVELCLEGLHYFQTYDWAFLMITVCCGYLGWIFTMCLFNLRQYTSIGFQFKQPPSETWRVVSLIAIVCVLLYTWLFLQSAPLTYYMYSFFPIVFWSRILVQELPLVFFVLGHKSNDFKTLLNYVGQIIIALLLLEFLVVGYYYREMFSICLLVITPWSFVNGNKTSFAHKISWFIACATTAIFPLLPVEFGESVLLVCLGSGIVVLLATMYESIYHKYKADWVLVYKIAIVLLSALIVFNTDSHLKDKSGLPYLNQLATRYYEEKLMHLWTTLAAPFTLLSISYEMLFYCSLSILLASWINQESRKETRLRNGEGTLSLEDIRTSLFYLLFCYLAFFGTGNIASYSSFEISSTYRFTTVFAPFLMGALLIWKVVIPFILVSCVYRVLNRKLRIAESGAFFLVVAMSDVMAMNFFFLVKDNGSWKEIGESISHFALANSFILVQLLLSGISQCVLHGVRVSHDKFQ